MNFDLVLFDLDGTLIDSAPGVFDGIEYALAQYDIHPKRETLFRYMGPPIWETFGDFLPAEQVDEAVAHYRGYYSQTGIANCTLYTGVVQMLQSLKQNGFKLALATSKPQVFAQQIMQKFQLADLFDYIGGASLDGVVGTKTEVIQDVLAQKAFAGCAPVMVGDRYHDLEGAKDCDIPAAAVLYGYGAREELTAYHPVCIADTAQAMCDWLLAHQKTEIHI